MAAVNSQRGIRHAARAIRSRDASVQERASKQADIWDVIASDGAGEVRISPQTTDIVYDETDLYFTHHCQPTDLAEGDQVVVNAIGTEYIVVGKVHTTG